MKKVLIACLSESLTVPVWFATSLAETFKLSKENDLDLTVMYSSSGTAAKQRAVDGFLEEDFDSIFFLNTSLQWLAEDFVKVAKSDHLITAAVTASPMMSDSINYNVNLKDIKAMPLLANSVKFDFINIDKAVFTALQDIVTNVSLQDRDGTFVQTPIYFADTLGDYGLKDEEYSFAEYLEKAKIDIVIDASVILFTHILSPHVSEFGKTITQQLVSEGFQEVYGDTAPEKAE
jgi:hypothetical protein